ncbi:MAG: hypothetical protein ACR2FY_20190 [Pirellulaceae bacterium]
MPALPKKLPRSLQFSLRFLLYVTTLIALFYALRRSYLMTAFDLDDAVARARNVPAVLALVAALLSALFSPSCSESRWSPAFRGVILGASVGSLSCLALIIEFGESLRQMDYWNWWRDWPRVAPHLSVATLQGGAIGAFVLQLGWVLRFVLSRRKAMTPRRSRRAL